jgi:hypothetical protein
MEETQAPLTNTELAALRDMMENKKRFNWLMQSLRIWIAWVSGAVVSAYTIWQVIEKFFRIKGV